MRKLMLPALSVMMKESCLNMVYADSLNAVSSPDYKFTQHPQVLADFEKGRAALAALPCDIMLSAHPEGSGLRERLDKRDKDHDPSGLIDKQVCERYVADSRERLRKRIAEENVQPQQPAKTPSK